MDGYSSNATLGVPRPSLLTKEADQRSALMQAVLNRATAGFIGVDTDLRVTLCNACAAGMLGVTSTQLWLPVPFTQFSGGSTKLGVAGWLTIKAALLSSFDSCYRSGSGEDKQIYSLSQLDGRSLRFDITRIDADLRLVTLVVDDTDEAPSERTDGLTGLSDRQWFRERLAAALVAPEHDDYVAVLLVDLDRFKAVNDSQGHPVGDALLQTVAQRLCSVVREGDLVSRLGGDEFAVLLHGTGAPEAMAQRLVDLLSRPYLIDGQVVVIGASIGTAVGPGMAMMSLR